MFRITNIKERANLVINNKNLKYGDSMYVDQETLEQIQNLIDSGFIKIEKKQVTGIEVPQFKINSIDNHEVKKELIEIFFKFHTNVPLEAHEINRLVWFYKNVSPISVLPESIKSDLDEVKDNDELIEILINQIYPTLLENFLNN